jgi:hypothetical protein
MIVRIRFGGAPRRGEGRRGARLAASALLTPAAVMALTLGCWGLAAERNWTGRFAISSGVFSHWEVWLAGAAVLEICARLLHRYARKRAGAQS